MTTEKPTPLECAEALEFAGEQGFLAGVVEAGTVEAAAHYLRCYADERVVRVSRVSIELDDGIPDWKLKMWEENVAAWDEERSK